MKQKDTKTDDGMDIIIIAIKSGKDSDDTVHVEYAGAKKSLYYIHDNVFNEVKADLLTIGGNRRKEDLTFTNHFLKLHKKISCILLPMGIMISLEERMIRNL